MRLQSQVDFEFPATLHEDFDCALRALGKELWVERGEQQQGSVIQITEGLDVQGGNTTLRGKGRWALPRANIAFPTVAIKFPKARSPRTYQPRETAAQISRPSTRPKGIRSRPGLARAGSTSWSGRRPGQEGSESSAMGLSRLLCRESPYFGELQELRADPAPRLGSWSAPKSTLMNHDAREKLFLNVHPPDERK